jgi:hypothetical protein
MTVADRGTTIREATSSYEGWLARQTPLVESDLARKHAQMAANRCAFFRATYYRWAERWSAECPELATSPVVLGVGDLHIENFGTWRDQETRLVWGVNDFDEAYPVAYANDLVRLAASALLAIQADHLALRPRLACAAVLAGYRSGLAAGGRPHRPDQRELAPADPYAAIVERAMRAHDPFLQISERWLVRRLAPDCSRVELGMLPGRKHDAELLESMGWGIANVHLGTPELKSALLKDLQERAEDWLFVASRRMLRVVDRDWRAWRQH